MSGSLINGEGERYQTCRLVNCGAAVFVCGLLDGNGGEKSRVVAKGDVVMKWW